MGSRSTTMVVFITVLATAAFAACSSQPEKAVTDRLQLIRVALEWALVDRYKHHHCGSASVLIQPGGV